MMTRRQIRDDILRRAWIERPEAAPAHVLADVATAVNQTLQTLHLMPGAEFFRLRSWEVTVPGGQRSVELPAAVQTVRQVRRVTSGKELRPVSTRSDILHYARRFLGADAEEPGLPAAYWLESGESGVLEDSVASTLHVAPAPAAATALEVRAEAEAPRYTAADMESEAEGIAAPHGYIESLVLPLARRQASRFSWFAGGDAAAARLDDDAAAALAALGLAAPWKQPESATQPAAA